MNTFNFFFALFTATFVFASAVAPTAGTCDVSSYNVVWNNFMNETSGFYINTMPLGNGDLAANLWFDEEGGRIIFIVSSQRAWSEANQVIKIGRVEYKFDPNPFAGAKDLEITMDLPSASVHFSMTAFSTPIAGRAYIHSDMNVGVLEMTSFSSVYTITPSLTMIRPTDTTEVPTFDCMNYTTSADVQVTDEEFNIIYHRNSDKMNYVKTTLEQLNLEKLTPEIYDPYTNLTMGLLMSNKEDHKDNIYTFTAFIDQTHSVETYLSSAKHVGRTSIPSYGNHLKWWTKFWSASNICITTAEGFQVAKKYNINRMLQNGMQGRSKFFDFF